jgi:hypothetical protein
MSKRFIGFPRKRIPLFTAALLVLMLILPSIASAKDHDEDGFYSQQNLVSNIPGKAAVTDSNLRNPWGLTHSSTSPWWVADNGTGVSTLYNGDGVRFPAANPLVVTIPAPDGGTSAPTGMVFNGPSGFVITANGK